MPKFAKNLWNAIVRKKKGRPPKSTLTIRDVFAKHRAKQEKAQARADKQREKKQKEEDKRNESQRKLHGYAYPKTRVAIKLLGHDPGPKAKPRRPSVPKSEREAVKNVYGPNPSQPKENPIIRDIGRPVEIHPVKQSNIRNTWLDDALSQHSPERKSKPVKKKRKIIEGINMSIKDLPPNLIEAVRKVLNENDGNQMHIPHQNPGQGWGELHAQEGYHVVGPDGKHKGTYAGKGAEKSAKEYAESIGHGSTVVYGKNGGVGKIIHKVDGNMKEQKPNTTEIVGRAGVTEATGVHSKATDPHNCATHVYDKRFGKGKTLYSEHAEPDLDGNIEWYKVMFEHGIEKCMTENLQILQSESHERHKKMKKEEVELDEGEVVYGKFPKPKNKSDQVTRFARALGGPSIPPYSVESNPADKSNKAEAAKNKGIIKKKEVELDEARRFTLTPAKDKKGRVGFINPLTGDFIKTKAEIAQAKRDIAAAQQERANKKTVKKTTPEPAKPAPKAKEAEKPAAQETGWKVSQGRAGETRAVMARLQDRKSTRLNSSH